MTRTYRKKRRAEQQQETRQRIVDAAVQLHALVGPASTSISAIADRAGVQRVTVYKHFPDEGAILQACSAHWQSQHPPPDPAAWASIANPRDRLTTALTALFAWYDENEAMVANTIRDIPQMPELAAVAAPMMAAMAGVHAVLAQGWPDSLVLHAALGHALDFTTWRSLVRQHGLAADQAVDLLARLVTVAADA
jgi:AcrR family transcriptional regulator